MIHSGFYPMQVKAILATKFLQSGIGDVSSSYGERTNASVRVAESSSSTRLRESNPISVKEAQFLASLLGWSHYASVSATGTTIDSALEPFRGAFDELERARSHNSSFPKALAELRSAEIIRERAVLAARLSDLLEAYQDDYGQSLNADSLRMFIRFLKRHPQLKRPIITATPGGDLFAEWKDTQDNGSYLGVQFLPMRDVRFVLMGWDPEHNAQRVRASGVLTLDAFDTQIISHHVSDWAGRSA